MSGSFRTDYHIDFTGSTTGTADSSSGSAQLIIWRARRHQVEDNDDMGGVHRVAVLCADTGVGALCQPPCRQERQGVVAWHRDSPVTTCKEDLEVIRVTVISNGHFNMPLGIT